jgi:hypothetical protein
VTDDGWTGCEPVRGKKSTTEERDEWQWISDHWNPDTRDSFLEGRENPYASDVNVAGESRREVQKGSPASAAKAVTDEGLACDDSCDDAVSSEQKKVKFYWSVSARPEITAKHFNDLVHACKFLTAIVHSCRSIVADLLCFAVFVAGYNLNAYPADLRMISKGQCNTRLGAVARVFALPKSTPVPGHPHLNGLGYSPFAVEQAGLKCIRSGLAKLWPDGASTKPPIDNGSMPTGGVSVTSAVLGLTPEAMACAAAMLPGYVLYMNDGKIVSSSLHHSDAVVLVRIA